MQQYSDNPEKKIAKKKNAGISVHSRQQNTRNLVGSE